MRTVTVEAGNCPYFADTRAWTIQECDPTGVDEAAYEEMLSLGFRRSGQAFYRPVCRSCRLCIPLRVLARHYEPTRSQRRVLGKNRDVTLGAAPLSLEESRISLYDRYTAIQHGDHADLSRKIHAYYAFLVDGAFPSSIVTDYWIDKSDSRTMAANGYLDVLPNGLSSVYFAWDPFHAKRSLGVLSVAMETTMATQTGKEFYYLGFWVPGSPKMDYKADYGPAEISLDGVWKPLTDDLKAAYRGRKS